MPQYYTIDSRKRSFGEYWRIAPSFLGFAIACWNKISGKRLDFHVAYARMETVPKLDARKVAKVAPDAFTTLIRFCESSDFTFHFYYTTVSIGQTAGYSAVLLSKDERIVAHVVLAKARQSPQPKFAFGFSSRCKNGTLLVTSGKKRELGQPPEIISENMPGESPSAVLRRHNERLNALSDSIVIIRDSELDEFLIRNSNCFFDHEVRRGIFVAIPDAEVAELRRTSVDEIEFINSLRTD